MASNFRTTLSLTLLCLSISLYGQSGKRIQPGKIYEAGDLLYAPRLGFKASVPEGWTGVLPRQSEVFLLSSPTGAQVFVMGREQGPIALLKEVWDEGVDLNGQIALKAKASTLVDGILSAEVEAKGQFINKGFRGYAVARCGSDGPCVSALAVMPAQQYEAVKKLVDTFMANAKFEVPSLASPYADFNWKEFLTNKVVMTYAFIEDGSKETTVHLCSDGKFTANVKKKGILQHQNAAYKGKLTGTWSVDGVGEKGTLHLIFDKGLPELTTELMIKEEQIYAGLERYFVADSDKCK